MEAEPAVTAEGDIANKDGVALAANAAGLRAKNSKAIAKVGILVNFLL